MDDLLRIENLRVQYHERGGRDIRAVDGVDLSLRRGEILAVVGESGCGKTTLGLSVLRLVPHPGAIETGRIIFDGVDLLALSAEEMRRIRGRAISFIFQDPVSGLNPVLAIGPQVAEIVETHLHVSKRDAKRMTVEALRRQGLSDPERIARAFPFQLSAGMCQRVMIAIATVLEPRIIIADEPTSSLDVTVQAAILHELDVLRRTLDISILLITHDLGVVAQAADSVAVMYAGRVIERGRTDDVYARARHPYTAALMAARPRVDDPGRRLQAIPGTPPDLAHAAETCAFLPRCSKAVNACRSEVWPALTEIDSGHAAACYNPVFQPVD